MEKGPFIQCPKCNCKYKTDVKYQKHMKEKHSGEKESQRVPPSPPPPQECCVCLENLTDSYMLYPCGHAQYCKFCAMKLEQCSLCRKNITDIVKVHF